MANLTNASGLSATVKVLKCVFSIGSNSDIISVSEVGRSSSIKSCCSDFESDTQVLLCTAFVKVNDSQGEDQLFRSSLILEVKPV